MIFVVLSYFDIKHVEQVKIDNIFRIYDSQCYQKIWEKTVDSSVSEGIILYDSKVLSVNKQFKDIIGLNQTKSKNQDIKTPFSNLSEMLRNQQRRTSLCIDTQTKI